MKLYLAAIYIAVNYFMVTIAPVGPQIAFFIVEGFVIIWWIWANIRFKK